MSPLEELKESVRENIEVHRRMGYDIGVARNEARLAAIGSLEAKAAEVDALEAELERTRRALEKEVAVSELATNEAKEWQSRALKAERMAAFIERQQLAPSIEREKQLEAQVNQLREALEPFGDLANYTMYHNKSDRCGVDMMPTSEYYAIHFTVGDLRRAAQVLDETGGKNHV